MISWSKVSRYVGKYNVIPTICAIDKNWSFFFKKKRQYGSNRIFPDASLFKMVWIGEKIQLVMEIEKMLELFVEMCMKYLKGL